MERDQIHAQRTYRSEGGKLLYVQEICGSNVIWCEVGNVDRRATSLKRFASRMCAEVPNQ